MFLSKMFNRESSGNVRGKSKVTHTNSSSMTSHRSTNNIHDKKNDWANSSSFYRKLSDSQKHYVDKISDILDRVDDEW